MRAVISTGPLHCCPGRANSDLVLSGLYGQVAGPQGAIAAQGAGDWSYTKSYV